MNLPAPLRFGLALIGISAALATGGCQSPDPYYNPPPLPPEGTAPSMDIGSVPALPPPPLADGSF